MLNPEEFKPAKPLEFEDVKVAESKINEPPVFFAGANDLPLDPYDVKVLSATTSHPAVKDILGFVDASGPITVVIGNTTLKYGYLTLGNINSIGDDLSVNDLAHILLSVDKNGMTLDDYSNLPGIVISQIFKEYAKNLKEATETIEFFAESDEGIGIAYILKAWNLQPRAYADLRYGEWLFMTKSFPTKK